MTTNYLHEIRVARYLFLIAVRRMLANRKALAWQAVGMILNNIIFFITWGIMFSFVPDLHGWKLPDIALMFGLGASAFGLSGVLFGGYRQLAYDASSGKLDAYLTRPASPLMMMLTSYTNPTGWGDFLTGPIFWLIFCHFTLPQFFGVVVLTLCSAGVCLGLGILIYSLAFWIREARDVTETILFWAISFMTTPLHGMPLLAKLFLFTVFPVAYISYLPVEIIRHPTLGGIALMAAGMIGTLSVARFVFYRGLRRYNGVAGALVVG